MRGAILELQILILSYAEARMALPLRVSPDYGAHTKKPALASKPELKRKAVGERKVGARVRRVHGCTVHGEGRTA
jgi:hypothetical protein